MRARAWFAVLLLPLTAPAAASAQSLFSTGGLGMPVTPLDGRARALGAVGTGLLGLGTSPVNPADLASIPQRGVSAALQPTSRTIELAGEDASVAGTRFPLVAVLYPLSRRVGLGVSYSGFLDQAWEVVSEGTAAVAGEDVRTRDLLTSTGGVAQVRVGLSWLLTPTLALGGAAGVHTGSLERRVVRTFPDSAQSDLRGFTESSRWSYSAPLAVVGIRWDPVEAVRVGASLAWSGDLEADGRDGAPDRSFGLPVRLDVGTSGRLAPRLLAALGGHWAGWGSASEEGEGPDADGSAARDAWGLGGGVEWTGARTETRVFPVRLGARFARLPFPLSGGGVEAAPDEWAVSLGTGLLLHTEDVPRAAVDATLERGGLSADVPAVGELTESFWRLSVSLALFGR